MKLQRYINAAVHLILVAMMITDIGYRQNVTLQEYLDIGYFCAIGFLLIFNFSLIRLSHRRPAPVHRLILIYLSLLSLMVLIYGLIPWPDSFVDFLSKIKPLIFGGLFIYLLILLSQVVRVIYTTSINPALVFVSSFALLIFFGAYLLTLPMATRGGISFIDALFTSTSAVSVTGLAVLDTGKDFTFFGQMVILILIQLGGLGILTITSFFAYFFRVGSSFQEGLYVKNFLSSEKLGGVLSLAFRIVVFTFLVEIAGAFMIFHSLEIQQVNMTFGQKAFFSIFHAISGYCNAGFSTLSNSLYEDGFRFNYLLLWVVAGLFILGGLGFNIAYNFYRYLRNLLGSLFRFAFRGHPFVLAPRIITLNTRIVLRTTIILILVGTIFIFGVEYQNTLGEHTTLFGKFSMAFFTAVTPRTAGFNAVDTAAMSTPSILMIFLLMWIGASPASTGGGIKTSTFAIATMNIFSIARDKDKIEWGGREISRYSVDRAFAIISLSLIVIGFAVFFISVFEPEKDLLHVAFECFSAYSTVGLSLGITPHLSDASKIVLILTMFTGRIGTINLLVGLLPPADTTQRRYPTENILIN